MKRKLIVMTAAELAPLVKVGGLGDVIGSLPKALNKLGVNIKLIIPYYGSISKSKYSVKLVKKKIELNIDNQKTFFDVYKTKLPKTSINIFLIKHKVFNSKNIYTGKRKYISKTKYSRSIGDIERFTLFSKAVVETIKELKWQVDVLHCHDWHTALIPTFVDEYSLLHKNFKNIKTLFTIHNLANQGISGLDIVDYACLHKRLTPALMEDYYDKDGDKIDAMKIGILSADYINTVSPTYAKEILTKEYGEDLEKYLQRRKNHLAGIVNGLDLNLFNPQKDKYIKKQYSLKNVFSNKLVNKEYLQKISKLPNIDVPVFGLVTRLVSQKGLDILIPALKQILKKEDIQLVVLGTGQPEYEDDFKELEKLYPDKVKANITFSIDLAQEIYAGSDFFLMPSRFEPCGLGQMIAMRYGSVPIVRATGGLKDTVKNNSTGFVFSKYNITNMKKVMLKVLTVYGNKVKMKKMIKNIMKEDFSWDRSAKEYLKLYNKLR